VLDQWSFAQPITTNGIRRVDLELRLASGVRVAGRVGRASPPPPGTSLRLIPADVETRARNGSFRALAHVMPDGAFDVPHVPPGTYAVLLTPADYVGVVVRTSDRGLWTDRLVVPRNGIRGVQVEVIRRGAPVHGIVRDAAGVPTGAAIVAAFPADSTSIAPPLFQVARPATSGRFALSRLPAGEIVLAAVADLATDAWRSPETLARLRSTGIRVRNDGAPPPSVDLVVR
jgi:hypothetical protein